MIKLQIVTTTMTSVPKRTDMFGREKYVAAKMPITSINRSWNGTLYRAGTIEKGGTFSNKASYAHFRVGESALLSLVLGGCNWFTS